jgi:hypothetical protein
VPRGCAQSRIQQQLSFLSLHRVAGSRIKPRLEAAFFFSTLPLSGWNFSRAASCAAWEQPGSKSSSLEPRYFLSLRYLEAALKMY